MFEFRLSCKNLSYSLNQRSVNMSLKFLMSYQTFDKQFDFYFKKFEEMYKRFQNFDVDNFRYRINFVARQKHLLFFE